MPSDSVADFLKTARARQLIPADLADRLAADPAVPAAGVAALCETLVARGVLTAEQAAAAVAPTLVGRYELRGELGPCPGGVAYRAFDPALTAPVELRRLTAGHLAGEPVAAFLARARSAADLLHPQLAHLLDAGPDGPGVFVVLDPGPAVDLATVLADIGPMPVTLAAGAVRQAARGLAAAHARGLTHGAITPAAVALSPVVPLGESGRTRPAADATARLTGLGLVPHPGTAADDVRDLGDTLAALVAGRPGVPDPLTELIAATRHPDPAARPPAAEVAARLAPFAPADAPGPDALADLVDGALAAPPSGETLLTPAAPPAFVARPADSPSKNVLPAYTPAEYAPADADLAAEISDAGPVVHKKPAAASRGTLWMWVGIAVGLQAAAVGLWLIYLYKPFAGPPAAPTPARGKR